MAQTTTRAALVFTVAAGTLMLSYLAIEHSAISASNPAPAEVLAQNFQAQHEIGRRFQIDPADLPAPKTGPIVTNRSLIVPFSEQTLQVPQGFVATLFASGLANPRRLLVLDNGDVLVC